MKLKLNPDTLTLGDLEDFEELSGQSLDRVLEAIDATEGEVLRGLSMRTVLALVFVVGRKDNPTMTYETVRALPISTLNEIEVEVDEDEPDPTSASV